MDDRSFKAKQAFCTRAGRLAILTEIAETRDEVEPERSPAVTPERTGGEARMARRGWFSFAGHPG